jgi:hypothetical protein
MKVSYFFIFIAIFIISCDKIQKGSALKSADVDYIRSLGLLDKEETIYQFYGQKGLLSSIPNGSFYSDKRVASYWIDTKDSIKNSLNFAYYKDVKAMEPIYNRGLTYMPCLRITKKHGDGFDVYAEGDTTALKHFFEGAMNEWQKHK